MKKKILILILIVLLAVAGYFLIKNLFYQQVGGCAGVHQEYWQECCDNWAKENNILHIQCVGEWAVENNKCSWVCS